jgi:hypothetical protein
VSAIRSVHVASKARRCDECGRGILPGMRYLASWEPPTAGRASWDATYLCDDSSCGAELIAAALWLKHLREKAA